MDVIMTAYDDDSQMIDSTSIRAHHHAARAKRAGRDHCYARSWGDLTTKAHMVADR